MADGRGRLSVEARMWDGLVGVVKETYTAVLGEETVPRPLMLPLVRGELVPGGELVPPIQAAVDFSFTPFGITVGLMEEGGYRISLTEAFAR
ncbi:hypothetical protein ACWEPR_36295 [Streptomyces sp. NPDC004290]